MKFKVTSRHIELTSASGLITAGSAGLDTCEFEWSAEWSGFAKTVVFRSGNVTASKVLVADNEVVQIPSKCLTTPNIPLEIGIYGQLGEKKMPTIWCVAINRVAIGTAPSDTGPEPTPSAYEQWVAQVQAYRDTAMQSASAAANSAADAALDVGQVDAAALSAVNSINSAGVEKVNAVNAAGAAQLNAINSAGESACAAIQSAKTDALSAINTQKTNSVSAVMSEGDTQVARVQQAAGYAYSKSESNARFAGALVVKESGNPITVYPDATGAPLTAISQRGKTTQPGTGDPSPTNIRPISGVGEYRTDGYYVDVVITDKNGTHTITAGPLSAPMYEGDKLTWSGGSTVEVVRARIKRILNGTEVINAIPAAQIFEIVLKDPVQNIGNNIPFICSHYAYKYLYGADGLYLTNAGNVLYLGFAKAGTSDKNILSEYIAAQYANNTPVTLVYGRATPTTETVAISEPITNAAGPITIAAENTVDVTYNKSLAKAFEQITAAIASLGTV